MAAVSKLSIRNVFADNTTATFTIDNLVRNNINVANIKQKVAAFNATKGGDLSTKMKSKNGFDWIGIDKVTLTTTNRIYIF